MEVKKIVEGMTAVEVAEVIDSNFKNQNKILKEDIATQNSVIGVSEYKDFSEAEAVKVGDVRKYNGYLYECVEATTGAFDESKWKKSSFKAETEKKLSELTQNLMQDITLYENITWVNGYISSRESSLGKVVSDEGTGHLRTNPIPIKKGQSFFVQNDNCGSATLPIALYSSINTDRHTFIKFLDNFENSDVDGYVIFTKNVESPNYICKTDGIFNAMSHIGKINHYLDSFLLSNPIVNYQDYIFTDGYITDEGTVTATSVVVSLGFKLLKFDLTSNQKFFFCGYGAGKSNNIIYEKVGEIYKPVDGAVKSVIEMPSGPLYIVSIDAKEDCSIYISTCVNYTPLYISIFPTPDATATNTPTILDILTKSKNQSDGNILYKKTIAFLGDSITVGIGASPSGGYVRKLTEKYGIIAINKGSSGTHLSKINETDSNSFINRISDIDDNIDMIVVFGGTNDYGHTETANPFGDFSDGANESLFTFYSGVHCLLKELYDKFGKRGIPVVIVTPLHHGTGVDTSEYIVADDGTITVEVNPTTNKSQKDYVEAIKEVSAYYGFNLIDAYSEVPINGCIDYTFTNDGLHPNENGYELLSDFFAAELSVIFKRYPAK